MRAAWRVEVLKLRRSGVGRTAAVVLTLVPVAMAAAFSAVALGTGDSVMASKVRPMMQGTGWEGYLGVLAQILSVAELLCVGIVVSWSVGREFTDGTVTGLLALPTRPGAIVTAKLGAVMVGAVGAAAITAVLALGVGGVIGLGAPDADALRGVGRVLAVAVLMAMLALPLATVASGRRGYLPAIGALLCIVVVTQVATVAGAGAWFPWAAPSLWAGMGGADAASAVLPVQLLIALPVAGLAALWTAVWWERSELG
ncbi:MULTISPECIES: ABC transporter permease [unclassified Actinotalea]|uniref:ABC transporter permease n=1 Tax=unclassified Actinotalea TaxID=2638618 RepID=UPI0015F4E306|nr:MULTISPECIES: ABC transporter permease [unclassified Actinotalea]